MSDMEYGLACCRGMPRLHCLALCAWIGMFAMVNAGVGVTCHGVRGGALLALVMPGLALLGYVWRVCIDGLPQRRLDWR